MNTKLKAGVDAAVDEVVLVLFRSRGTRLGYMSICSLLLRLRGRHIQAQGTGKHTGCVESKEDKCAGDVHGVVFGQQKALPVDTKKINVV
jgi:hypothetical protein